MSRRRIEPYIGREVEVPADYDYGWTTMIVCGVENLPKGACRITLCTPLHWRDAAAKVAREGLS